MLNLFIVDLLHGRLGDPPETTDLGPLDRYCPNRAIYYAGIMLGLCGIYIIRLVGWRGPAPISDAYIGPSPRRPVIMRDDQILR